MTIESELGRKSYAGDGSSTAFATGFKFFQSSDLKVIRQTEAGIDIELTENVDYAVSGAGSDLGGTVTLTTPPASGETLTIILNPALTQLTDYVANDDFPAESHERALDRRAQVDIRLRDLIRRCLRAPDGDADPVLELPGAAARAGKFMRFDDDGNVEMADVLENQQALSRSVIAKHMFPITAEEAALGITEDDVWLFIPSHEVTGVVNLWRYRADPSGTASAQTAMTYALGVAKLSRCPCYAPGGFYRLLQFAVPNGVILYGAGIGEYGVFGDTDNVTVFFQHADDVDDDDLLIFVTDLVDGFERLQNGGLRDFVLLRVGGGTAGCGISFRKAGDRDDINNHAILAGTFFVYNVLVRGFPGDGADLRRGAVGNVSFSKLAGYFNGGYGINIRPSTLLQNLVLDRCGGDGNTGGAAINLQTNNRDASVTLIAPWGEYRTNSVYGPSTGFNAAQPYTVRIGDFGSTSNFAGVVTIVGGSCLSSYNTAPDEREAPDAGVLVDCTNNNLMPEIIVSGFQVVNETSPTITSGNGSLLYDKLNSVRISGDKKSTYHSFRNGGLVIRSGGGFAVLGGDGEYHNVITGSDGLQIVGTTPALSFVETDGPANEKRWNFAFSAGTWSIRLVDDTAGTETTVFSLDRNGAAGNLATFAMPFRCSSPFFQLDGLPTFADDSAAGTGGLTAGRLYKTATGEVRVKV